jgi:ribonuclease Z
VAGWRKLAIGLIALGVIACAGLVINQARIGEALFARAVGERVGRDATAGLPDGLHVALCGTGSPLPNPERAGPCTVVIVGQRLFVVDAGEGGARNIQLMGLPPGRIERLFLTHFHSDHIDGLGPMLLLRWTGSAAAAPLPVHGPAGVEAVVGGFNAAYAADHTYRIAHHGEAIVPASGAGAAPRRFDLPEPGTGDRLVVFKEGGVMVTAFRVNHDPVNPAVGYRFDYRGRSVVISGDTTRSASLEAAAKGADLLVHEALQPRLVKSMTAALGAQGLANTATITSDILTYHASPEDAADSATTAGVRQLVLSHIVPPIPGRFFYPAFLGDAPARFAGPIIVGEDGMMFSLPTGSTAIDQRFLL